MASWKKPGLRRKTNMTLRFRTEWQDAPGVKDVVDQAAWARLVIELAGEEEVLTRCIDRETRSARDGVYGSVFPLTRWLVDSYWHLLYEGPRVPGARSGRDLASFPRLTPWLRRHNLLTAREGYSLPDVSIARDGDYLVLSAFPDLSRDRTRRPVRFVHQGIHRVEAGAADAAFIAFVGGVLERLRDVDHPDVVSLREDWDAVLRSRETEPDLCIAAARLGLDPYDQTELTREDEQFLASQVNTLPTDLRTDLLDATDSMLGAREVFSWLSKSSHSGVAPPSPPPAGGPNGTEPAHRRGYWAARAVRKEQGLKASEGGPILGRLASSYGLPFETTGAHAAPRYVDGLLTGERGQSPTIVGPVLPHEDKAFRWSRGLYVWRFGHAQQSARMITRSQSRLQRESRAFAAELLAPAAAIRRSLRSDVVGDDEIAELAEQFTVRPRLIRHQIENHRLAMLD